MTPVDPRGVFWEVIESSSDPPSLIGSRITENSKDGQKWPYEAKMTDFDPKMG